MRTQTLGAPMTVAEYRRIVDEIIRQIASEERQYKKEPPIGEDPVSVSIPTCISDGFG